MTAIIIIGIIVFIIFAASSKKKKSQQNTTNTNSNNSQKSEKEIRDELLQNCIKDIKVTVTTSNSSNNYNDDSIIDVTDHSYRLNTNSNLKKYSNGVPYWAHHYCIFSNCCLWLVGMTGLLHQLLNRLCSCCLNWKSSR